MLSSFLQFFSSWILYIFKSSVKLRPLEFLIEKCLIHCNPVHSSDSIIVIVCLNICSLFYLFVVHFNNVLNVFLSFIFTFVENSVFVFKRIVEFIIDTRDFSWRLLCKCILKWLRLNSTQKYKCKILVKWKINISLS